MKSGKGIKGHKLQQISWKDILLPTDLPESIIFKRTSTSIIIKGRWKKTPTIQKDIFIVFITPSQVTNYDYHIEKQLLSQEAEIFAILHENHLSNLPAFYGIIEESLPKQLQDLFLLPTTNTTTSSSAGSKVSSDIREKIADEDCFGFVIEALPKKSISLQEYLHSSTSLRSPLTISEKMHLLYQMILTLTDLHAIRYIHGDFQPNSIYLNHHHPPVMKIMNYRFTNTLSQIKKLNEKLSTSLVQAMYRKLFQSTNPPYYYSPEILRNFQSNDVELSDVMSASADVYAFGIISWELLAGQTPAYPTNLVDSVISGDRPDITLLQQNPSIPLPIIALIQDCWKAEPASRPTSAVCLTVIQECLDLIEESGIGENDDLVSLKSSSTKSSLMKDEAKPIGNSRSSMIIRSNSSDTLTESRSRASSASSISSDAYYNCNLLNTESVSEILDGPVRDMNSSVDSSVKQSFNDLPSWIKTFHLPTNTAEKLSSHGLKTMQRIVELWTANVFEMEAILLDITTDEDVLDRFVTALEELTNFVQHSSHPLNNDLLQWLQEHDLHKHDVLLEGLQQKSIISLKELKETPLEVIIQELALPLKAITKRKFIQGWKTLNGIAIAPTPASSVASLPASHSTAPETPLTTPLSLEPLKSGDTPPPVVAPTSPDSSIPKVLERELILWLNEKSIFQPEITRALKKYNILTLTSFQAMPEEIKIAIGDQLKPITRRKFLLVAQGMASSPLPINKAARSEKPSRTEIAARVETATSTSITGAAASTPTGTSPVTTRTSTPSPSPASIIAPGGGVPRTAIPQPRLNQCTSCHRPTVKKYFCENCVSNYERRTGKKFLNVCYHCCYCGKRSLAKDYCDDCFTNKHSLETISYYYCYHCGYQNDQKANKTECFQCHKPAKILMKMKKNRRGSFSGILNWFGFGGSGKKKTEAVPATPSAPPTPSAPSTTTMGSNPVTRSGSAASLSSSSSQAIRTPPSATSTGTTSSKPPRRCLQCNKVTRKRYFCEECVQAHEERTGTRFNGSCILCRICKTLWTMNEEGVCNNCADAF